MSNQKHSSSPVCSSGDTDAGSSVKHRPQQTYWTVQRLLARLTSAGGLVDFEALYTQGHLLGTGGYGSVYRGIRRSDGLQVAIKCVPKARVDFFPLGSKTQVYSIPQEVYLMHKATDGPDELGQSAAVTLLEWFDFGTEILLVMERPNPAMDLLVYSMVHDPLPEETIKEIAKQLVLALIDLHQRGIFHRALKTSNILIQEVEDSIRIRIIDFGSSCMVRPLTFQTYCGTPLYTPPEFFLEGQYWDVPTTVWQLGAIMVELVKGEYTTFTTYDWMTGGLSLRDSQVSEDCKNFINSCLQLNPSSRNNLEQFANHPWLNTTLNTK